MLRNSAGKPVGKEGYANRENRTTAPPPRVSKGSRTTKQQLFGPKAGAPSSVDSTAHATSVTSAADVVKASDTSGTLLTAVPVCQESTESIYSRTERSVRYLIGRPRQSVSNEPQFLAIPKLEPTETQRFQKEFESLQRAYRELQQNYQVLEQQNEGLARQTQGLQQQNQGLRQQNQSLQQKAQELTGRIEYRDSEIRDRDKQIRDRDYQIRDCDQQIQDLQQKNEAREQRYRREVVPIRNLIEASDLLAPNEVGRSFQDINRAIGTLSRSLSEILSASDPLKAFTIADLAWFARYPRLETNPNHSSAAVEIEDLIDYSCRSLLNQALMNSMFAFSLFDPTLNEDGNRLISQTYDRMRLQETQVIAGRFRTSWFTACQHAGFPSIDIANNFCRHILLPLCRDTYGTEAASQAVNMIHKDIEAVFGQAWEWYKVTNTSVVSLEFRPFYAAPSSSFDAERHISPGKTSNPPTSEVMILTSALGLVSSVAVGHGKPPEEVVQSKAVVVTDKYILGP